MLPIEKRIGAKIVDVEIGFRDAKLQKLFNDHRSLEVRFGLLVAKRIASRMGVLKAAARLSLVPLHPPIALSPLVGTTESFSVTVAEDHRLFFTAREKLVHKSGLLDLDVVTEIEILGLDPAIARSTLLKARQ